MRHARLTWKGAYHHVMNRGLNKKKIFEYENLKNKYIKLMAAKSSKYGITIFAYCVMDNHFHICLENTSGKLSGFMKSLNGHYGQFFRKSTASKGYVFEDRFKSTLIQDEKYLSIVIKYILQNPVRSGYVSDPFEYPWSSIKDYFNEGQNSFVKKALVEEEFSSKKEFLKLISSKYNCDFKEQLINKVRFFGDKQLYLKLAKVSSEDAFASINKSSKMDSIEKIQKSFECEHSIKISEINIRSHLGKRLRNKFLLRLRNELGLTYKEINEIDCFTDLTSSHLRKIIYQHHREP